MKLARLLLATVALSLAAACASEPTSPRASQPAFGKGASPDSTSKGTTTSTGTTTTSEPSDSTGWQGAAGSGN